MDAHNLCPRSGLWLLFCLFQMGRSTAPNRYETDNDQYWKSTSYFTPIRGRTYGGIKRRKSMHLSLKFVYYGKTVWHEWENILRIGEYGNGTKFGCTEHGNRYPALFILPSNDGLQISLSDPSDCFNVITKNYVLHQNIIYNLAIDYNQTHSTTSVSTVNITNNKVIQPSHLISNKTRSNVDIYNDSLLGAFMDVIISDPLTKPANVLIFDMEIRSYNEGLQPPQSTALPTLLPTDAPTIARSPVDDVDVHVTIAMNYTTNNSNTSSTNEVIREITESVMNGYVDDLSNTTNASITVVTIRDPEPYDVVLGSNYTTSNDTAVYLEAAFENRLETEILETIGQSKNGSITINHFDIEITISDSTEFDIETTPVSTDGYSHDNGNMLLIWYISIGGIGGVFCIFIIGFYVGFKFNDKHRINARKNRLQSQMNNAHHSDDEDLDIGNIQMDERLKQSSNDDGEDEDGEQPPPLNYHLNQCHIDMGYRLPRMSAAERNEIRHTIYCEVMGTPSGIQPIAMNHVHLAIDHLSDDIGDDEEDEDIEDLYQDSDSDVDEIYEKPQVTAEGGTVLTETAPVAIPYYHSD